MDVDTDVDQNLLQQFSSMGTTDKEVLVQQFQKVLGHEQLGTAGCEFFLDMNNWNLQAAICSYYDFEAPKEKVPCMSFVKDVTIGEGESVPPNTKFLKTWRIQNSGEEAWPQACSLKFTCGDQLGPTDCVPIEPLPPKNFLNVSVEMVSPSTPGIYRGQWRMCTATGMYFGEIIWVILSVEENGLLGVTQQLQSFDLISQQALSSNPPMPVSFLSRQNQNPFAPGEQGSITASVPVVTSSNTSLANGYLHTSTQVPYSLSQSLSQHPTELSSTLLQFSGQRTNAIITPTAYANGSLPSGLLNGQIESITEQDEEMS